MDSKRSSTTIKKYFSATANRYESLIIPAFRHFAAAVITTDAPQPDELALDVGTGTGILARLIAPHVHHVTGIDFAPQMIAQAQMALASEGHPNVAFAVSDAHDLPFPGNRFDRIVSSFGLNATRPRRAFKELHRILKPGGRLVFHEWSVQHHLDSQLIDVLATYMLPDEDVSDDLFEMREFTRTTRQWDNLLQDSEDFEEILVEAGFASVQVWEDKPVDVVMPLADFMDYKFAWTNRRTELMEMDDSLRGDCLDAIRAMLQKEMDRDGNIHYDPMLFRVVATSP